MASVCLRVRTLNIIPFTRKYIIKVILVIEMDEHGLNMYLPRVHSTKSAANCWCSAAFFTPQSVRNSAPLTQLPLLFSLMLADLPLGLVLIRQKALVGTLPGNHKVYKITKIAVIPLSDEEPQELELEVCTPTP